MQSPVEANFGKEIQEDPDRQKRGCSFDEVVKDHSAIRKRRGTHAQSQGGMLQVENRVCGEAQEVNSTLGILGRKKENVMHMEVMKVKGQNAGNIF